jgi:hypothetical protein
LRALGGKGILIKAAEQGYTTQLACKMPQCFCPEELGGAGYFEPVTDVFAEPSDGLEPSTPSLPWRCSTN